MRLRIFCLIIAITFFIFFKFFSNVAVTKTKNGSLVDIDTHVYVAKCSYMSALLSVFFVKGTKLKKSYFKK